MFNCTVNRLLYTNYVRRENQPKIRLKDYYVYKENVKV